MASHGGMLGAAAGVAWFAWRQRLPFLFGLDLIALAAPAGLMFGRIANFINGELWGRPVDAAFPLAVRFPQEFGDPELLADIRGGVPAAIAYANATLPARHPSQLYAAGLEGVLVLACLLWFYRRPRVPGRAAAVFGLAYAAARIAGEFFREPDAELGLAAGLSRGQWLSLGLAATAAGLLAWTFRRPTPPLGGIVAEG